MFLNMRKVYLAMVTVGLAFNFGQIWYGKITDTPHGFGFDMHTYPTSKYLRQTVKTKFSWTWERDFNKKWKSTSCWKDYKIPDILPIVSFPRQYACVKSFSFIKVLCMPGKALPCTHWWRRTEESWKVTSFIFYYISWKLYNFFSNQPHHQPLLPPPHNFQPPTCPNLTAPKCWKYQKIHFSVYFSFMFGREKNTVPSIRSWIQVIITCRISHWQSMAKVSISSAQVLQHLHIFSFQYIAPNWYILRYLMAATLFKLLHRQ